MSPARRLPAPVTLGLIAGVVLVYLAITGIVVRLEPRDVIAEVIGVGRLFAVIVILVFAYRAAGSHKPQEEADSPGGGPSMLLWGAVAGGTAGGVAAAFVLLADAVNLRSVLINASPEMVATMSFEQSAATGALYLIVGGAVLGALAGAMHLLPPVQRKAVVAGLAAVLVCGFFDEVIEDVFFDLFIPTDWLLPGTGVSVLGAVVVFVIVGALYYAWKSRGDSVRGTVGKLPDGQLRVGKYIALALLVLILVQLPQILDEFHSEVLGTVGIYVLIGLGLNIVVGFAGLLDLGYVAFFAIGAYSTAILTSPDAPSFNLEMNFWIALPIVVVIATVAGILIGAPVLRLRGDYLAIVTLGFGEIIRVLVISNWLIPVTGGAQGITQIPDPIFLGVELDNSQTLYYLILLACLVAALISYQLQDSRVGRAWSAMREDESVAEAMGVSIIRYKLLAFATGAAIGSLSGILFGAKIGSVFPASFNIMVSILALAVIVLGGMGSVPGVVVGAAVLVGLPELLREFEEYRLLFYGAILVAIMILKPEGLIPSARVKAELGVEETPEEQYEERAGDATAAPVVTGGPRETRT